MNSLSKKWGKQTGLFGDIFSRILSRPWTPLRIQLDKWLPFHDSGDYVEVQEYVERTAKQNGKLWSKEHIKLDDSQSKMKKRYNCRSKASTIEVGNWVLLDVKPRGDSLSPLFRGPWKVEKRLGLIFA